MNRIKRKHYCEDNQLTDLSMMVKPDHHITDNGAKVNPNLLNHQHQLQSEKADDKECEETIKLSDHSDDDGASNFANIFMKKMAEDAGQKDMSYINPCQGQKLKSKSQLLVEKPIIFDDDTKDGDSTISFSEPNSPQEPPSRNLRPRSARAKKLVDVDPLQKFMAKLDPGMEDVKVYYPSRDDSDAVEVGYADMSCLAPEAYISSVIMNFYIRCLQQSSSSSESATGNFHFFTTYFYNKLEKLSYKEDSFLKFRKWWKGVNIFEKAYIFLPVHENAHWSLVIICFPSKEDEMDPILLHLDSLGLHDSMSLFSNIKRFLKEEWSYVKESESYVNITVSNEIWENLDCRLNHKTVMVPQQKNEYDCGLFVLFYMERFIKDAPERFTEKHLSMFSRRWFRPQQASNLRAKIFDLLVEEFKKAKKCWLEFKGYGTFW